MKLSLDGNFYDKNKKRKKKLFLDLPEGVKN